MPLRNHLKEYRVRLDVNQQQMGQLVGTSRQTISQIERGDYSPSVTLALKIAKVCNAKVEDIFAVVLKISLWPVTIVSAIWLTMAVSYAAEGKRLSKSQNEAGNAAGGNPLSF